LYPDKVSGEGCKPSGVDDTPNGDSTRYEQSYQEQWILKQRRPQGIFPESKHWSVGPESLRRISAINTSIQPILVLGLQDRPLNDGFWLLTAYLTGAIK